jgi:hypothetical protein
MNHFSILKCNMLNCLAPGYYYLFTKSTLKWLHIALDLYSTHETSAYSCCISPLDCICIKDKHVYWRVGRVGSRCWRRTRHRSAQDVHFTTWNIYYDTERFFPSSVKLVERTRNDAARVWHQTPHHIVFGFLRKRRWWRRNGNMFSLLLLLAYRFKRSPVSLYRGNKQYFLPFLFLRRCNTPWMIWGIVRMLKRWIN